MRTPVAGLVLIGLAVVAAIAALPRLVENQILAALADAGVTDAELTVATIDWREASITDIRIGDGLTIAEITVRYSPEGILDGRLHTLIIDRLTLRGAVRGDGVSFTALEPLIGEGGGETIIPLDEIVFRESRIELATSLGEITTAIAGTLHIIGDRDLDGLFQITLAAGQAALTGRLTVAVSETAGYDVQLEIAELTVGAGPAMAGEIAASLRDSRLAVDGALYTPDGALALTADITIADIAQRRYDLNAELWVTDPPALDQAALSQGRMALTLSGVIPGSTEFSELALRGGLDMDLDDVTLPGIGDGLSLSGAITVETIAGVVTVASDQGLRLDARHLELPEPFDALMLDLKMLRAELRPSADGAVIDGAATGRLRLEDIGVFDGELAGSLDLDSGGGLRGFDLRRLAASAESLDLGGMTLTLEGLDLALNGRADGFSGTARLALSADQFTRPGLVLAQPRLAVNGRLSYGEQGFSVSIDKGASLDAASLEVAGLEPIALHVETSRESVIEFDGARRLHHDLWLSLPPLEIGTAGLIAVLDVPELRFAGSLGETYSGGLEISGGAVELPGQDLMLDGIDTVITLDDERIFGEFTIAALRHPQLTPLGVVGTIDLSGDAVGLVASLNDGDALDITIEGYHDLAVGSGGATFELARLTFDPAAIRPGDFSPALDGLAARVRGTIAAQGKLAWDDAGMTSEMTLLVEDVSLDAGDIRLERINAVIAFDSLWPPSTPPAQRLAIGLIDAGLPLTDGIVDFQLRPDYTLYVENAVWRWAGGRLKTRDVLLDAQAERHEFTLEIDGLDLAEIVALADMDDLSASGRLSGRAPVTVTAEGVAISDGLLQTAQGGVLRYAPREAPAALRLGGEGATLALSVLENFRYETLAIDIERDVGGDAEIAVHLRGSNPDVYDGYPIEFNLNISGPIDRMLRRGLEGYRVPDAVAERLQGFGGD